MNETVRASIDEVLMHSRNRLRQVEETIKFTQHTLSALFAEETSLTRKIADLEKFLAAADAPPADTTDSVAAPS